MAMVSYQHGSAVPEALAFRGSATFETLVQPTEIISTRGQVSGSEKQKVNTRKSKRVAVASQESYKKLNNSDDTARKS